MTIHIRPTIAFPFPQSLRPNGLTAQPAILVREAILKSVVQNLGMNKAILFFLLSALGKGNILFSVLNLKRLAFEAVLCVYLISIINFDVDAERLDVALRDASLIPVRNKYFYGLSIGFCSGPCYLCLWV